MEKQLDEVAGRNWGTVLTLVFSLLIWGHSWWSYNLYPLLSKCIWCGFMRDFPSLMRLKSYLGYVLERKFQNLSLKSIQAHKQRETPVSLARGTFLTPQFGGWQHPCWRHWYQFASSWHCHYIWHRLESSGLLQFFCFSILFRCIENKFKCLPTLMTPSQYYIGFFFFLYASFSSKGCTLYICVACGCRQFFR